MKDLPLSFLSRGCGRLVLSNRNTGRHDGRLDVCFTPQDYYIWKSKDTLLRLSNSGRLFAEAESTLPKTYSTRRGALLLYSQDMVTVETNHVPETRLRKERVVRRGPQQMEQRLSTLKELTAAILSYSNNQYISSRLAPPFFPPLHLHPVPKLHCPIPASIHTTQAQPSSELLSQLNPQWLPAEGNTETENQPEEGRKKKVEKVEEDTKEEQDNKNRVRVDLFLQIPCTSRTPTPQMKPQPWVHYVAMTPEEPEEPETYTDSSLQRTESSQHTETNHHITGGDICHPNMNGVCDVADDRDSSIQDGRMTADKDDYKRSISGNRHGRAEQQSNSKSETNTTSGLILHPQKVGNSVYHGSCSEKKDRPRCKVQSADERRPQRLPPIGESCTVPPGQGIHAPTQRDAKLQAERVQFQPQENLNRLHQQPPFLPLLFPENEEEMSGKQRGGREKTLRQYFKKDTVGKRVGEGRQSSEKGSVILLEPGEELQPPVGVMGCAAGWKGPGKQSSLAFLQNRVLDFNDPSESSDANRGVVKGVLPLQLRDFPNGKSVGCLILGPDGEIIQLSLYDNSQDSLQGDGDSQQQALQVLSTEGEELPWVIVLQPEPSSTEGGVELNTCVPEDDTRHHQPICRGTESHTAFGQFATEELSFSSEQLLDHQRSTETNACSPSSHTDTVLVTKKKTKSVDALLETWKKPKNAAKNSVRMPPLREGVGKEELRGDSNEEEEEEEELPSTEQNDNLYGSHQPGERLQNISPAEATTKEAVDKRRKRNGAEEAAITTRKRDVQTVKGAESDAQGRRRRKEGKRESQKPRIGDVESIRSQKQEGRTNREAAETQDHSAPSPVKKKIKKRGGGRGEVKTNEERDDQDGETARQRERRRERRGRLKHEESVVGSPQYPLENEEVEINQEMQEGPHQKSTRRPSATQTDSNNATTEEDTDSDFLSTSDKYSSIQPGSSLRSTVASSHFNPRSSMRSLASSCEGTVPASAVGLTSSRGRLSSCSTVMITEEQLMLNPVKPRFSMSTKSQEEEEAAALHLAQRAERRRQEVERKRREQEEEERKQQEREQTEERMKNELEEERRKRAEELRLKKLAEEEETRRCEEEEQDRVRREQAQREREKRRQEERRRQIEQLRRMREEEEQRRKAELERLRLEEEKKQEEENKKLQEMDESERIEYLCRKEEEEEDRRNKEEERKRREQEAALLVAEETRLQAELLTRQMVLLEQQLAFKRSLMLEAGGLEKTQGISRPWIYSYFALLQLLGLNPS